MTVAEYLRCELSGVSDDADKSITLTGAVWQQIIALLEHAEWWAKHDAEMLAEAEHSAAEFDSPAVVEQRRIERREKRKAYEARRKARGQAG